MVIRFPLSGYILSAFVLLAMPASHPAVAQTGTSEPAARDLKSAPPSPTGGVLTIGPLEIATPWLRATPSGATVAGGYLSVTNRGNDSERLLGASIPLARKGEIHEMNVENGTMHMRALPDGLEIKPGETVELKPGATHIMFLDLTSPLKEGDSVEGMLTFAHAGTVSIMFKTGGIADRTPPAGAWAPKPDLH